MCVSPITIRLEDGQVKQVPCGKCLECRRKIQNSWMLRLSEEIKDWKSGVFFTLTYEDSAIPKNFVYKGMVFRSSPDYRFDGFTAYDIVDEETGEMIDINDLEHNIVVDVNSIQSRNEMLEFYQDKREHPIDDNIYMFNSVRKKDVQEWIRRCRNKYKRHTKKDIKYFITSEYGPGTWRPHYHGIIYGVTLEEFKEYFKKDWVIHFGPQDEYRLRKDITVIADELRDKYDGNGNCIYEKSSGVAYVAKYCSKGTFEHPFCSKDFFYWYSSKDSGKKVCSEYHSKHYERCIEYFDVDEPIVDRCERLISTNIGIGFIERSKSNGLYKDFEDIDRDVISYDLIPLHSDAIKKLGLNDLHFDEDGNAWKRPTVKSANKDEEGIHYDLDELVDVDIEDKWIIEYNDSKPVNQYVMYNGRICSKAWHMIEEMNLRREEFHCLGGTFYSDSLYDLLLNVTNKLTIWKYDKKKKEGFPYAMPKYYREKMFDVEIQHLLSCAVCEEHDRVYKEQFRQISTDHPIWKDYEVAIFIEGKEREEQEIRRYQSLEKVKKFIKKSKL